MNPAHVHLLLNHLPVIGTGFAMIVFVVGIARRSDEVLKISLALFVAIALIAIPTYVTGEPAGNSIEKLPGVSKAAIERHDDAAEVALAAAEVLGAICLIALFLMSRSPRIQSAVKVIVMAGALVVVGLMAYTANLGGQIRHTEIGGAAVTSVPIQDADKE